MSKVIKLRPGTAPDAAAGSAVRRILLVEDDSNDAELMRAYLAEACRDGAEVLHVRTLAEGLALQRSMDVHLTLLDLDLPDSAGFQTLELMRAAAAGPVVVVSGNGHPKLVEEVLKRRAYDVIPKHELDAATLRRVLRLAALHQDAGKTLRATEGRIRALLENSAEALVLFNAEGRIEYASAAIRRVLGYESSEVQGRNGLSYVHAEDRDNAREAFRQLAAVEGANSVLRVRFVHQDGSPRVLECALVNRLADPDVAGIVCSFRDLSREEEQRARFDATFEHAAVGLAHVDNDGRMLIVNRRLCEMLGYGREELVGRTVREFSHPEDLDATAALRAQLRAGKIPQFTMRKRYQRKDASVLWVQLTVSLERDTQGAPLYDIAAFEDVSEMVRAEEKLRASEARLRAIIGAEPECVKLLDPEGLLLDMNPAGLAMIEADSLETVAGQCVYGLVAPEFRAAFTALTERACRGGRGVLEFEIVGLKGTRRWMEMHAVPMRGEAGGRTLMLAITRDVSARKSAELAAQRVRRMYAALSATNEAILRTDDAEALYRSVCALLVEHAGLKLAAVRLVDRATGWIESVAHAGEPASYLAKARVSVDRELPNAHGPAGQAVQEGRTIVNNDYLNDPSLALWHGVARESGIASTASIPLRRGGSVVGLITLYSAETNWFDPELVGLAERMVDNVSFALDNIDREAQRARAVHALRESEARFRSLTELSSDWYWEQDAEFRFSHVSIESASPVFGPRPSVIGKARWELPLTPLSTGWEQHKETLQARRTFRDFEFSYAGADGQPRYVSASGYPMYDAAGRFQGYRGIGRDITQRKQAESALRRFRAALDISADSIYLVDVDAMRVIDFNDAAARNLGYERDELLGAEAGALFADRTLEDLRAQYEQLLERDTGEELVRARHRRKDGSLMPMEVTRRVLRTPEGRYIVSIARDLTERLRSEERLSSSHERFETVSRATNDVVWDWNLVTDEVWWNENFQTLFGYESREIGAYADAWRARIHPEDVGRIKSQVDAAIATGARAWVGEYRVRRKDGSYVDVYDRGLVMHDAAGRAVRMIGALMDISERKHAEGRLRVHAERQAAIARFGQFALGRRSVEELYTEAARALHCEGVDAVSLLEMFTERNEYLVRATQGEGPHASLGQTGPMTPDSVWPEILRENAPRIAGRAYLVSRPLNRPWRAWVHDMGSAVYAPVRDDDKPIAMLCVYAVREHAFGAEDVRFAEAVGHVLSTALQRQKAEERLARLAQFDALTGLPNRTLLQDRLGQSIVQARRRQVHAGVLFVDLDRFKLINDTLGHYQGDALIRQVGQRLLACVRPGDTVGRISGDEFGVVLADMARPDDAALVAQKILDALAAPFDLGGNEAYVTASIGIAAYPGDGDDAETLLKNADMAMYRAKESARNSYCFFTAEMNQRALGKMQLNTDLRHALERGEFTLHYQTKVDLASGALRGLEALLRWNHPVRGLVSPMEFVPALEDSGLIVPVGEWVIAEACAQIRRWEQAGLAPVPVAVNLSAKQFLRRDLDGTITRALAAAGVPARLIELEITESCLMDNPEEAVRALSALRDAGLKISVDDFGTGYSSLAYLARFPLSALKIDRAFVRNVHLDTTAAAIVRAVIDMANNLNLVVIAEGVETEQQAAFLRRHGCHQGQGYLFSRPVPADEVAGRLRAARPGAGR